MVLIRDERGWFRNKRVQHMADIADQLVKPFGSYTVADDFSADTVPAAGASTPPTLSFGSPAVRSLLLAAKAAPAPSASLPNPLSASPGVSTNISTLPPGGGAPYVPQWMTAPASNYQNTSLNQAGWLGGDPNTGKNGDPGAYNNLGGGQTIANLEANPVTAPPMLFSTQVQQMIAAHNFAGAVQLEYNTVEWSTVNLADTSSGQPEPTNMAALTATWEDGLACVGSMVIAAATIAAIAEDPALATVPQFATFLGSALVAVSSCVSTIFGGGNSSVALDPGTPAYAGAYSMLQGAGSTLIVMSRTVGDFSPPGDSVTSNVQGKSMTMTPKYTPSASFLAAARPDMTAAAIATYFPHG